MTQLTAFYSDRAYKRPDPSTQTALDSFQAILSSVREYPILTRALGLTLDFMIPITSSGSGSWPTAGSNEEGTVSISVDDLPVEYPATVYSLALDNSANAPYFALYPRGIFKKNEPDDLLVNGYLNLQNTRRYSIEELDTDSGGLRYLQYKSLISQASSDIPVVNPSAMPALVSGGLAIVESDRWEKDEYDISDITKPYFAEHLVRGYRVLVQAVKGSESAVHSLCKRNLTFYFKHGVLGHHHYEDEGWASVSESADPFRIIGRKDVYQHEALLRWKGWSLVCKRPVKHLHRPPLPSYSPPTVITPKQKLPVTVSPPISSLPRLRFGADYRLCARAVDVAGNDMTEAYSDNGPASHFFGAPSAPPPQSEGDAQSTGIPIRYGRYEPVPTPVILLRESLADSRHPRYGETLEHVVLRTYSNGFSRRSERHLVPPRIHQAMAEAHGMFDSPDGFKQDAYQTITSYDGRFPKSATKAYPDQFVFAPYLPDPFSKGVLFQLSGLGGQLADSAIGFSGDWPGIWSFRIALRGCREGHDRCSWDSLLQVLNIHLAPGRTINVNFGSFMNCDDPSYSDVRSMAIWQWILEAISPTEVDKYLKQAAEGRNPLLTPQRTLTLIHAVEKPVSAPQITGAHEVDCDTTPTVPAPTISPNGGAYTEPIMLDGVSGAQVKYTTDGSDPTTSATAVVYSAPFTLTTSSIVRAVASQQGFSTSAVACAVFTLPTGGSVAPVSANLTASKYNIGDTDANFNGSYDFHGPSTGQVDVIAYWIEKIDNKANPGPSEQSAHAVITSQLNIPYMEGNQIQSFSASKSFGDSKYRELHVTAMATTRYLEQFVAPEVLASGKIPPGLSVTNEVPDIKRWVRPIPSSARPSAPSIESLLPTFGWEVVNRTHGRFRSASRKRRGGGIRVYLNRPWYSSGDGELLGAVLAQPKDTQQLVRNPGGGNVYEIPFDLKPLVSQSGIDPIWGLDQTLSALARPLVAADFLNAAEISMQQSYSLEEISPTTYRFLVVPFDVQYDASRKLWFCDIQMNVTGTYFPFVRLALARFQPNSLFPNDLATADCALSRVALTKFVQPVPDRTATVIYKHDDHFDYITAQIQGLTYNSTWTAPQQSQKANGTTIFTWQVRDDHIGWQTVSKQEADDPTLISQTGDSLWQYTFKRSRSDPDRGRNRVIFEEYETYTADGASGATQTRLVYADILEI